MNQPWIQVIVLNLGLQRMSGHQCVMVMTFTKVRKQNQCLDMLIQKRRMKEAVGQMSIRFVTCNNVKYMSNIFKQ